MIRAAEHKAVPKSEQLRLLSMAIKDLTGTELNLSASQKGQAVSLMDLPEVFGASRKAKLKTSDGAKGQCSFTTFWKSLTHYGLRPLSLTTLLTHTI